MPCWSDPRSGSGVERGERKAASGSGAEDWLALYLVVLGAATLSPFWLHCAPQPWLTRSGVADVVQNLVLFVPLGFATRRAPVVALIVLVAVLSGGIEWLQRWLPRSPSPWDLAANTGGALLGRWVPAQGLGLHLRGWRRPLPLSALALAALAGVLAWPNPMPPNDFSSWQPYPLLLGNELTGDRPWHGTVSEIAVYDRALEGDAFDGGGLPAGTDRGPTWEEGGPILWIRFASPATGRLDGPGGPRPLELEPPGGDGVSLEPDGVRLAGGRWVLPTAWADHVRRRLQATDRISVAVRFRTADLDQEKTARILSMSRNPGNRDFTLGQDGRNLAFRTRTPAVGPNGVRPHATTFDAGLTLDEHHVTAVFDGSASRILRDGQCRGDAWIAVARGAGPRGKDVGLAVVVCVALGTLALRSLIAGRRLTPAATGAAFLGAAIVWGALWAAGLWSHLPGFGPWALVLGAAAFLATLPIRVEP